MKKNNKSKNRYLNKDYFEKAFPKVVLRTMRLEGVKIDFQKIKQIVKPYLRLLT